KGLKNASEMAVLNANYLYKKLGHLYEDSAESLCMHEFVVSAEPLSKECGVRAIDLAKGMMDHGVHPPTIYFPLIVKEAMMFEPTETESLDSLDDMAAKMTAIFEEARKNPDALHNAPVKTPIGRADEVMAARNLVLKYSF
ncbi:MAG: aminomethyl-transferring glycine dehydrogenase subunit GcvPB, partial [Bacteroidales bacterium]